MVKKKGCPVCGSESMCDCSSDKTYAGFMLESTPEWHQFAGRVFLLGVKLGWTREQICEYVFETYHGMDLETETPKTVQETEADMVLYTEHGIRRG